MDNKTLWKTMGLASVIGLIILVVFAWIATSYDNARKSESAHENKSETTKTENNHVEKSNALSPSNPNEKVEYASKEWSTHGGDLFNRRYSTLDQINTDTIKDLKPTWVTSLGSGKEMKYSGEATPIVQDGVMYVATGANDVLALDVKTGEKIWEYRPNVDQKMDTVCCGWTTRGVAIGDGKIYAGLLDARLVALDMKTGKVVWETEVADWKKGYTVTSAPLYYNGKVYTGVSGGEYGIRGRVMAYDSKLGREVWRFYTIPTPYDENGGTWPKDNDAWQSGGGPVWNTPAVDPELGTIYFATGNTAPDLDGSNREGDNLYANSIVALNAETGEYKWHFQEVHHDIWDMDPTNPVILFDVEKDGKMRKGLGQAGKTGWVYFLDRETGKPLVGIDEKEVPQLAEQKTAKTQPFPVGDSFVPQSVTEDDVAKDLGDKFEGKIGNIFTPFWDEPVTLKPGPFGGANWPPSAYNPDTEYFYVLGNDSYFSFARKEDEAFKEGSMYVGSILQPVSEAPVRGTLTALDVKTNKIAWQVDWDSLAYSGILTTKGNLVFAGHNDGRLIAYNAQNGEKVWAYKMDAGANAPAVTYEVDGEQYVSILAAGNALAGSKHGDKVYTFKLNGNLPDGKFTDASAKKKATKSIKKKDTVSANTDKGLSVYTANCLACHGDQGANGHNGPNLQESTFAEGYDNVVKQVTEGGSTMPSFKNKLSKEEIDEVAKYISSVVSKADGK